MRKNYENEIVTLKNGITHPQFGDLSGCEIRIEGYWNDLTGGSWRGAVGNPAALMYAVRTGFNNGANSDNRIPLDDEVLYGKYDGLGLLIHVNEIEQ